MPIASTTVLNLVDAMASTLGQAMQLARARLASAASPSMQLMIQREHEVTESELLRRELKILRAGRENAFVPLDNSLLSHAKPQAGRYWPRRMPHK
ncbi:MAG: hypothetical protein ACYCUV_11525 [Phycisphaerae bacterium]